MKKTLCVDKKQNGGGILLLDHVLSDRRFRSLCWQALRIGSCYYIAVWCSRRRRLVVVVAGC